MKRLTKVLSLILAIAMLFTLAACSKTPATNDNNTPADTNTPSDTNTPADDNTQDDANTPDDSDEPADTEIPAFQLPIVDEPVTVKFWWPTVEEMLEDKGYDTSEPYLYFQEMEKRTGVHVDIDVPDATAAQTQFGLVLASGEYPDFMENFSKYYTAGMDHAVEEDLIVPLNDKQDIMPNFFAYINADEEIRKQCTTDAGYVPGVPFIKISLKGEPEKNWCGMAARGEWLDELGMEVPTTYDEMTTLLGAMKEKYSDTAPYPLKLLCMQGDFVNQFGNAFHGGYNFSADWMQIDGKVTHGILTEGYKQFYELIRSWIVAEYIDPDFLAARNLWLEPAESTSDEFGVFSISYTNTKMYLDVNADRDYTLVGIPVLRVDENTPVHIGYTLDKATDKSVIMADSEYVDILCKWWDYFFTDEGILLGNYGVEGQTFEYNENGEPEWIPEAFYSTDPRWNNTHFQCAYLLFNTPGVVHFDRELTVQDPMAVAIHDVWIQSYDTEYNYPAAAAMTVDEQERYTDIMTDINTFISEQKAKFLTGELSFENGDWETFVDQVRGMGIEEAVELKQAAYDRYNKR